MTLHPLPSPPPVVPMPLVFSSMRIARLRVTAVLLLCLFATGLTASLPPSAVAQERDTTQTLPDSVAVPPPPAPADTVSADTVSADTVSADTTRSDTTRSDATRADTTRADTVAVEQTGRERPTLDGPFEPVEFTATTRGRTVTDTLSARLSDTAVSDVLGRERGAFVYDIGPEGWPHGVSFLGLPPNAVSFWLEDRRFHDPVSGRPRYDLVPVALLEPLRTGVDMAGTATGVYAEGQNYGGVEPLTQLRYRRDSNGLSRIDALHTQKRQFDRFGPPGVLDIEFGYSGATASGEYAPGTEFDLYRAFLGRVRYRTAAWAFGINNLAIRHRVGAHGGIPPVSRVFESIYLRPLAQPRYAQAFRQTVRNDLTARARGPMVPGLPKAQASVTWTSDTFDFTTAYGTEAAPDTSWVVRTNTLHGSFSQPLEVGAHRLTLTGRARLQARASGTTLRTGGRRQALHASLRDSVRVAGVNWILDAGLHHTTTQPFYPSASVRGETSVLGTRLFAAARLTGRRYAWMETDGFEGFVDPITDAPSPQIALAEMGLRRQIGPFNLGIRAFAHQRRNAVDLYARETETTPATALSDSVEVLVADEPFRQAGVSADLGWRTTARRGLYAQVIGTAHEFLNPNASTLHARTSRTLPSLHARGQIGARFLLFQDLIFDARVGGRMWSEMASRLLHTPTGRLVVPPLRAPEPSLLARPFDTPLLPADGVVNVHVDIDLYGAILFFTFENILGGTQADLGSLVVPTYPLPDQQFRFGVYWAIFD